MQKGVLVLDEHTLRGLTHHNSVVELVPELKTLKNLTPPKQGCGSCAAKTYQAKSAAICTRIKQQIATLPDDKKEQLKKLLNASQLRMYITVNGKNTAIVV